MKIYISGPITGTGDHLERFAAAERQLREKGACDLINPAELDRVLNPEKTSYHEIMAICLKLVDLADMVALLPGWHHSRGCRMERARALKKRKLVIEFEDLMKGEIPE